MQAPGLESFQKRLQFLNHFEEPLAHAAIDKQKPESRHKHLADAAIEKLDMAVEILKEDGPEAALHFMKEADKIEEVIQSLKVRLSTTN